MEQTNAMDAALHKQEQQKQKHQSLAQDKLEQGMTQYQQFLSQGCEDTSLFSQALTHFCQAIEQDKNLADAYLALGHAHLLIEDQVMAHQYFRAVLEFDPENPVAKGALENLAESPIQYDNDMYFVDLSLKERYQNLEKQIAQQHKELSLRLSRPTLDKEQLYVVEDYLDDIEAFVEDISLEVTLLEAEMDVTGLQNLLEPFRDVISQQEKVILQSYDLMEIGENLKQLKARTQNLLTADPEQAQAALPELQDSQKVQLQRIDYLKTEGYDTLDLEREYQQWELMLDNLQDIADDDI